MIETLVTFGITTAFLTTLGYVIVRIYLSMRDAKEVKES